MNDIFNILLGLLGQSKEITKWVALVPDAFKTGQELYKLVLRLIVIAKRQGLLTEGEEAELDAEIAAEAYKPYQQIDSDPVDETIDPPTPPTK